MMELVWPPTHSQVPGTNSHTEPVLLLLLLLLQNPLLHLQAEGWASLKIVTKVLWASNIHANDTKSTCTSWENPRDPTYSSTTSSTVSSSLASLPSKFVPPLTSFCSSSIMVPTNQSKGKLISCYLAPNVSIFTCIYTRIHTYILLLTLLYTEVSLKYYRVTRHLI